MWTTPSQDRGAPSDDTTVRSKTDLGDAVAIITGGCGGALLSGTTVWAQADGLDGCHTVFFSPTLRPAFVCSTYDPSKKLDVGAASSKVHCTQHAPWPATRTAFPARTCDAP